MKELFEVLSFGLVVCSLIASYNKKYDLAAFLVAIAIWGKL